jgi:hypothetical protein
MNLFVSSSARNVNNKSDFKSQNGGKSALWCTESFKLSERYTEAVDSQPSNPLSETFAKRS